MEADGSVRTDYNFLRKSTVLTSAILPDFQQKFVLTDKNMGGEAGDGTGLLPFGQASVLLLADLNMSMGAGDGTGLLPFGQASVLLIAD